MKAYGLYDVQLVVGTGVQLSDERDEKRAFVFMFIYIGMRMRFYVRFRFVAASTAVIYGYICGDKLMRIIGRICRSHEDMRV